MRATGDHRRRLIAAAIGVAAIAPAIATGEAVAATTRPAIAVDKKCYVRTSAAAPRMSMTGSGFAPGGQVTITDRTGTLDATTTADATGRIDASFAGPGYKLKSPGQVKDTITASERSAAGTITAARTTTYVSILGAGHGATKSARGLKALTEPTDWVLSGWPVARTIYVHYLLKHKPVARQSFGRAVAPCGVIRVRRPLYPSTPHAKSYATQIDASEPFSVQARPRFTLLRVGLQLEF